MLEKQQEEQTKACIVGLRSHHSAWDREARLMKGIRNESATNRNTKDSVIEAQLSTIIHDADEVDKELLAKEQIYLSGQLFDDKLIKEVGNLILKPKNITTDGKAKAKALKGWFNI